MKSLTGNGPRVYSDDFTHKVCNCPIHEGKLVPLEKFWVFKKGPRKGKPCSWCIDGERISNGRNPRESGLMAYSQVRFIFKELEFRIGRAESCRRMGISLSFWLRHENTSKMQTTTSVEKQTVLKALKLLRELRATNEVRDRRSISHGAAARGRQERIPKAAKHFNGPDDHDAERKRRERRLAAAS